MANPNVNLAPYDPQQQAIDRRRALAQALQQQSFEPIEAPPIPGALTSPLQGVSKLVQAIMAGYANRRLDKEQKSVNERIQGQNTGQANSLVAALMGAAPQQPDQAAPPQMPLQLPQDSQTIGAPPPDTGAWDAKRQALAAAMVSPNPALAKGGEAGIADVLAGKRAMEEQRAKMAEIQQGQQFTAGQNDLTRNLEQQRITNAQQNFQSEAAHRLAQEKVAADLEAKPKAVSIPSNGRLAIIDKDGKPLQIIDGEPADKNQGFRDRVDSKGHTIRDYFHQADPTIVTASADLGIKKEAPSIVVQTVDANGQPITKIVPKTPGSEFASADAAKTDARNAAALAKDFKSSDDSLKAMKKLATNNSYASDQAMADQFFNIIKPGTGARMNQQQIERFITPGPLKDRMTAWAQRLGQGQPLTPAARQDLIQAAQDVVDSKRPPPATTGGFRIVP